MNILSSSHKIELSLANASILTAAAYLSPSTESGWNTCRNATEGCRTACLGHSSGMMVFPTHKLARIAKTELLFRDREGFALKLRAEIRALERKAAKLGVRCAVRLNGSSDIPWEYGERKTDRLAGPIFSEFPNVDFYDYTKNADRVIRSLTDESWPVNYRLTFSRSGENDSDCERILALGGNVAAVFAVKDASAFPAEYLGVPTISGETHDYRFGDPRRDGGYWVALKARGKGIYDRTGFVIRH